MYIGKESGVVVSAINQITSWKNYKFEKAKERKSERSIERAKGFACGYLPYGAAQ